MELQNLHLLKKKNRNGTQEVVIKNVVGSGIYVFNKKHF